MRGSTHLTHQEQRLPESPGSVQVGLPRARGPLSRQVIETLRASPTDTGGAGWDLSWIDDPLGGNDFHLALYLLYELHYRCLEGVDPCWEWQPGLVGLAGALEARFEAALYDKIGPEDGSPLDVPGRLKTLVAEDGPSLSKYLRARGSLEEFKEFMIHRSAYQLKEADPHSWVIPRLSGPPKSALMEIQFDEYGSGDPARMHSELFAVSLRALGLDSNYGAYLDRTPGVTLATVNLMTFFGLHRRWQGALVGHLAAFEMSSSLPNGRYASGLRRLGLDAEATGFYDEHVEADSVHEAIAAHDLAGGLAAQEPRLAPDIIFGARCLLELESRFGLHLLHAWGRGESSLFAPEHGGR